jgi:hypothetical protein
MIAVTFSRSLEHAGWMDASVRMDGVPIAIGWVQNETGELYNVWLARNRPISGNEQTMTWQFANRREASEWLLVAGGYAQAREPAQAAA